MSRPLSIGDAGPEVHELQQALAENGFSCGSDASSVPPVVGPETLSALRLFQSCNVGPGGAHLAVDGVAGPDTLWALGHAGDESPGHFQLGDMPPQQPSNPVAAAALSSAWEEFRRGVREIPDGSNRGGRIDLYTGFSGQPPSVRGPAWCSYFASWNFAKSPGGSPFGRIGGAQAIVAYCRRNIPGSVVDYSDHGSSDTSLVKPGDLGVIPTGPVHGHVFHVAAVSDGQVWTVEGNCGNAVRTRRRPVGAARYYVNFDEYCSLRKL